MPMRLVEPTQHRSTQADKTSHASPIPGLLTIHATSHAPSPFSCAFMTNPAGPRRTQRQATPHRSQPYRRTAPAHSLDKFIRATIRPTTPYCDPSRYLMTSRAGPVYAERQTCLIWIMPRDWSRPAEPTRTDTPVHTRQIPCDMPIQPRPHPPRPMRDRAITRSVSSPGYGICV